MCNFYFKALLGNDKKVVQTILALVFNGSSRIVYLCRGDDPVLRYHHGKLHGIGRLLQRRQSH